MQHSSYYWLPISPQSENIFCEWKFSRFLDFLSNFLHKTRISMRRQCFAISHTEKHIISTNFGDPLEERQNIQKCQTFWFYSKIKLFRGTTWEKSNSPINKL